MHFTPSTNNALESFNRVIKDKSSLRERLPLSRFRILALETVEKWSNEYANGFKEFKNSATITLELWTQGYQWAKKKKTVISVESENSKSKLSLSDINMVKSMKWNSFQKFKEIAFSVYFVTLPKETSD